MKASRGAHTKQRGTNNTAFAANTFVTTALLTWLPSYFQRIEAISASNAACLFFPAISSLTASVLLFIAFYFFRGRLQYMVLLGVGGTAVAFVPAAVAPSPRMWFIRACGPYR